METSIKDLIAELSFFMDKNPTAIVVIEEYSDTLGKLVKHEIETVKMDGNRILIRKGLPTK